MLKLYTVIYVLGHVAASLGPWPEGPKGDALCAEGKQEQERRLDLMYRKHPNPVLTRTDFRITCEYRETPPNMDEVSR